MCCSIYYFVLFCLCFSLWKASKNSEINCTFRADSETRPPPLQVLRVLGTVQLRLWNTRLRPALFSALLSKMRLRTWTRLLLSDCSVQRMATKLVWYINPPLSPDEALSAQWLSVSMPCDSSDWHFQCFCGWGEKDVVGSLCLTFYWCLSLIHKNTHTHTVPPAALFISDLCKYLNQIFGWFGFACKLNKESLENGSYDNIDVKQRQMMCFIDRHYVLNLKPFCFYSL